MSIVDRRVTPHLSKPIFSSNVDLSTFEDSHPIDIFEKTNSNITHDSVKRATSTQALADFLASTGPEEFFEKSSAKRGSKLFSRLRKKSPNSTNKPIIYGTPKKYVEIIPNYPQPRDDWNTGVAPVSSAATKCAMEISKALSAHSLKVPLQQPPPYQAIKDMTHVEPRKPMKENRSPSLSSTIVPPIPLKNARRNSKMSLASSSGETVTPSPGDDRRSETRRKSARRTSRGHEMDLVEAALSHRIEARRKSFASSNRSSSATTANDFVATEIANEHVKALQLTSAGQIDAIESNSHRKRRTATVSSVQSNNTITATSTSTTASTTSIPAAALNRRRIRHAQVQTSDLPYGSHGSAVTIETQTDMAPEPCRSISTDTSTDTIMTERKSTMIDDDDNLTNELYRTIELLQQQLAEEQRSKRRLMAAMRDSRDKSELLSALAYKKLRELWEEKCKWEGDCLELRDRLMELEGSESGNSM
ncbi:hypothetical protein BGW37DRAFT_520128 [Umbelopsis sp. PMI_123]|nr:hypothetical protein BGW37DRAFT_520128 [Umbelopsis sp. PMI_123]